MTTDDDMNQRDSIRHEVERKEQISMISARLATLFGQKAAFGERLLAALNEADSVGLSEERLLQDTAELRAMSTSLNSEIRTLLTRLKTLGPP